MNDKTLPAGLPAEGFVRMQQLVGDPGLSPEDAARLSTPDKPVEPRPARAGVLPVTAQHLRAMVRRGQFPAPRKLGPKVAVWPVEEVRQWLDKLGKGPDDDAPAPAAAAPPGPRRRRAERAG